MTKPSPLQTSEATSPLVVGSRRKIMGAIALQQQSPNLQAEQQIIKQVPAGSIIQVVKRQAFPDQETWLFLKACSVSQTPLEAEGWIKSAQLEPFISANPIHTSSKQLGACATSPIPNK